MATKKNTTKKTTRKTTAAKKATAKKPTFGKAKATKKLSALAAAVNVLGESKSPMTTKEMIEAMAAQRYWKSPGGATPWATLYSAITRKNVG